MQGDQPVDADPNSESHGEVPNALNDDARADVNVGSDAAVDTGTVRATLDAWRERGADHMDCTRFRVIDALERRAASYRGTARQVLERRLATLVAAYANDLERATERHDRADLNSRDGRDCEAGEAHRTPIRYDVSHGANRTARAVEPSPLAKLVESMRANTRADGALPKAVGSRAKPVVHQEVEVLDYFREVWSKLSSESQWRQFSTQVPENAGPLNTEKLMVRSLSLMRDLSPEYLRQFLAYVNALSWMQELAGEPAPAKPVPVKKEAPRAPTARKGSRAKGK